MINKLKLFIKFFKSKLSQQQAELVSNQEKISLLPEVGFAVKKKIKDGSLEPIKGTKGNIKDRINAFLVKHDVNVSDGILDVLFSQFGHLPPIDIKEELKELIVQYKKKGVFLVDTYSGFNQNNHELSSREFSISNEYSEALKDIALKLDNEKISYTEFRLRSLTKAYISGDREQLNRYVNLNGKNDFNSLGNKNDSIQSSYEYEFYDEDISVSYTENDQGGGIGDDMDSFDYSDDLGEERY